MDFNLTGKQSKVFETTADEIFFGGAVGGGKVLARNMPILTPFGWKLGKDLKVGDLVNHPDGHVQRIIQIHPEVTLDKWIVEFTDGTKTEVAKDHLWEAWKGGKSRKIRNKRTFGRESSEVVETQELANWLERGYTPQIPVCSEQSFNVTSKQELIDPYVLGVLLGDGSLTKSSITLTCHNDEKTHYLKELNFPEEDVAFNLDKTIRFRGETRAYLKQKLGVLKLLGTKSDTKFIPNVYKWSSLKNRYALIQGLMDTDGYNEPTKNNLEYTTVSEQLANDVADVIRGLGGLVTISTKQGSYKNKDGEKVECKIVYRLYIKFPEPNKLFRLKRKHNEHKPQTMAKRVKAVYPNGEKITGNCITVSTPDGLYITNDFIVTHNSFVNKMIAISVCMSVPNAQVAILRNTSKNLRKNYFSGAGSMPQILYQHIKAKEIKIDYSNLVINFNNGAAIHFMHSEHVETTIENLQGLEFAMIIFDEAALIHSDIIVHAKTRLRLGSLVVDDPFWSKRLPRLLLSSNPGGISHRYLKENYINPAPAMQEFKTEEGLTAVFIPSNFRDNPAIDHEAYEKQIRATGDPVKIAQLIDGDWDAGAASIFEHSFRRHINVLPTFRIPDSWPVRRAYDDGWSSPFSVNWIATVTDENDVEIDFGGGRTKTLSFPYGTRIVVDEWYGWNGQDRAIGLKMDPKEIAKGILKREEQSYYGDRVKPGAADNAIWNTDRPVADDMRSVGVSFVRSDKSKGSRVRGWKLISEMMKNAHEEVVEKPALYFMEHCIHVIEDISSAPVSKKDPDDIDTDSLDHTLDSLRYEIANKGNSLKMVNCIGL